MLPALTHPALFFTAEDAAGLLAVVQHEVQGSTAPARPPAPRGAPAPTPAPTPAPVHQGVVSAGAGTELLLWSAPPGAAAAAPGAEAPAQARVLLVLAASREPRSWLPWVLCGGALVAFVAIAVVTQLLISTAVHGRHPSAAGVGVTPMALLQPEAWGAALMTAWGTLSTFAGILQRGEWAELLTAAPLLQRKPPPTRKKGAAGSRPGR